MPTRSTLTEGSTSSKSLSLPAENQRRLHKDRVIFINTDQSEFDDVLAFLRRSKSPVFWAYMKGFDFARYAKLEEKARFLEEAKLGN